MTGAAPFFGFLALIGRMTMSGPSKRQRKSQTIAVPAATSTPRSCSGGMVMVSSERNPMPMHRQEKKVGVSWRSSEWRAASRRDMPASSARKNPSRMCTLQETAMITMMFGEVMVSGLIWIPVWPATPMVPSTDGKTTAKGSRTPEMRRKKMPSSTRQTRSSTGVSFCISAGGPTSW